MGRPQIVLLAMIGLFIAALAGMFLYRPAQPVPAADAETRPVGVILPAGEGDLYKYIWSLTDGEPTRAPNLIFAPQGRFTGFSGCNRISGTYALAGATLTFGTDVMSTRMACAEGNDAELAFLDMLKTVTGWTLSGDTLAFTAVDGRTVATFKPAQK